MTMAKENQYITEAKFSFSNEEFCTALEDIDKELQMEDVVPRMRSFLAFHKLEDRFPEIKHAEIVFGRSVKTNYDGYTSYNLIEKISEWFNSKYEKHMQIGDSAICGRLILLVENEPYEIDIPVVLGTVNIIWDIDYTQNLNNAINLPQKMNLPSLIAKRVSQDDVTQLRSIYKRTCEAFCQYDNSGMKYVQEALEDERNAIDGIIKSEMYGQSKWASLQFTEKLIKGIYCQKSGDEAPRTHKLLDLRKKISPYNLLIDEDTLRKIDCTPGIRYGDDGAISRYEAIGAHIASMQVFRRLMSQLYA